MTFLGFFFVDNDGINIFSQWKEKMKYDTSMYKNDFFFLYITHVN